MKLILIVLMFIFSTTDCWSMWIPNFIVIPAIIIACLITHYWLAALIMFIIGAFMYHERVLGGGDVKLLSMVGAFLGFQAIIVFLISRVLVAAYRMIRHYEGNLPYAPFLTVASLCVIL